jgi:hypothetical protein
MQKIKYLFLASLLAFFFTDCSRLNYDITPDSHAVYHSLRLKFNVKNRGTGKRQNFKVLLKFNNEGDKMLFLSPLNQIYGMLFIEGEKALLINWKKKRYWQGNFRYLLHYMWGETMDFRYSQFKDLIVTGRVPEKIKSKNIKINVQRDTTTEIPIRLIIQNPQAVVKIKISNRETKTGQLNLSTNITQMNRTGIKEIME